MRNLILIILAVILAACTEDTGMSPVYETVEVHDTVFVSNDIVRYDTVENLVVLKDTVVLTKRLTDTVTVEKTTTDTVLKVNYVNDTIMVIDTMIVEKTVIDTVIEVKVINDTIVKTDTIVDTKTIHDTVTVTVHDTIHVSSSSESSSSIELSSSSSSEIESSSSVEEISSSSFDYEYDTFEMKGIVFTAFSWNMADALDGLKPADVCESLGFKNISMSDIETLDKSKIFNIFETGNFKKNSRKGYDAVCSASENKCLLKTYSGSHRIDLKSREIVSNIEKIKVIDLTKDFYPFYLCKKN